MRQLHNNAVGLGWERLIKAQKGTDSRKCRFDADAILTEFGGQTVCDIRHPSVYKQAQALGTTRSTMAMRLNTDNIDGGIVAVGNAPTALLEVIRLVREEGLRPALVVGVPVGFVKAVESKDELLTLEVPYITAVGRKGGSNLAASVVNALILLALEETA
mgnify:CR=1 FL=1